MGIGSFLSNAVKGATSGIMVQDGMQDWQHAAKVFTAEDMIRSPKMKGMYHVSFIFNEEVMNRAKGFAQAMDFSHKADILSVLTKSIDLPKFNIEHTKHNQYNKTTYTYKKIQYDPITVTFHDDMTDYVWALWAFYYTWYFSDGNIGYNGIPGAKQATPGKNLLGQITSGIQTVVNSFFSKSSGQTSSGDVSTSPNAGGPGEWDLARTLPLVLQQFNASKIDERWTEAWGMNGSPYHSINQSNDKSLHLLKAIEIYPLGTKKASVIVLHNPKITSWDHDNFDYSAQGPASCKMSLVYEGVTYVDQISAATVLSTVRFYDTHSSPLMRGSPRSLLGPGGILDSAEGVLGNIANGNFGLNDLIKTVGIAKSLNDSAVTNGIGSELKQAVANSVSPSNINKQFPAPKVGG